MHNIHSFRLKFLRIDRQLTLLIVPKKPHRNGNGQLCLLKNKKLPIKTNPEHQSSRMRQSYQNAFKWLFKAVLKAFKRSFITAKTLYKIGAQTEFCRGFSLDFKMIKISRFKECSKNEHPKIGLLKRFFLN